MQMTRLEKAKRGKFDNNFPFLQSFAWQLPSARRGKGEKRREKKISPSSPSGPKRIRRLFFWLDSLFLFSLFCNDIRASIDSHKSCFLWLPSALFSAVSGPGPRRSPWDGTGGRRFFPTSRQQSNKSSRRLHGLYQRDNQGPRIAPSAALSDSGWRSRWRFLGRRSCWMCLLLSRTLTNVHNLTSRGKTQPQWWMAGKPRSDDRTKKRNSMRGFTQKIH